MAAVLSLAVWRTLEKREEPFEVRLDSENLVRPGQGAEPLRLAIAPVLSPDLTVEAYQSLSDYLSARMPRPVRLVQRKTYGEVNELLRHATIQAAIICTGAYVRALMDNIKLDVIAVPSYKDGPVYYSLIVVRSADPARSLNDLKGRSFAFTDPLSLSGHYYAISALLDMGANPAAYFSKTTFTYSHDGSMRAVLDGIADGAAVDSLVYEDIIRRNPGMGEALRVVHRSPPLGAQPVVVPASLDPTLREGFQKAFLGISDSVRGHVTVESLGIERFVVPPPGLYDSASQLVAKVNRYLQERR
ncbi:MAG: phosphate/phosphite/phosphonate ABC transporter substrate-binding protein [Nitrospirae bacterium]|nr:phosphate/phosphite/phosphonate ABC transporter substrate-binding protein [Nitrospirota bacterium]